MPELGISHQKVRTQRYQQAIFTMFFECCDPTIAATFPDLSLELRTQRQQWENLDSIHHLPESLAMRLRILMRLWLVGLSLLGTMSRADDRTAGPEKATDDWQIVQIQGQRVGYAHTTTRSEVRDGHKVIITEVQTHLAIVRFGTKLINNVDQVTEEDEDGQLLSATVINENPPSSRSEVRVTRHGQTLKIESASKKESFLQEVTLPDDVKSATWIDRELKEHPLQVGETRSFQIFEPTLGKVTSVTLKQLEPEETKLLSGEVVKLQKAQMSMSILPGMVTTTYTDDSGMPKKTMISLLGMESYSCTKEEALQEIAASNIDLGIDSLVKVGRIDKAYDAKVANFEITAKDFDPTTVFPNFATQELTARSPGTWTLKLTSVDPGTPGTEPAPEAKYLSSSRHVDLSDPLIVKLAGEIAPGETDPAKIAIAAEAFVHKYLNLKNYSTAMATASEVAASRSGDCTEHGVLLTALLRVKKIPSRVVVGLVYVPSLQAFGGHMWTEAYLNGRWAALDATLARGRGDAMHIKTADSALENSGSLPIESFLPLVHSMGRMTVKVESVE